MGLLLDEETIHVIIQNQILNQNAKSENKKLKPVISPRDQQTAELVRDFQNIVRPGPVLGVLG